MKNQKNLLTVSINSDGKLSNTTFFFTSEKRAEKYVNSLRKQGFEIEVYFQNYQSHSSSDLEKIENGVYVSKF